MPAAPKKLTVTVCTMLTVPMPAPVPVPVAAIHKEAMGVMVPVAMRQAGTCNNSYLG